jgi:hypothetical protein
MIGIENLERKGSLRVLRRCRQPGTPEKLKLGLRAFAVTRTKPNLDRMDTIRVDYRKVVQYSPKKMTWQPLVSKVNDQPKVA